MLFSHFIFCSDILPTNWLRRFLGLVLFFEFLFSPCATFGVAHRFTLDGLFGNHGRIIRALPHWDCFHCLDSVVTCSAKEIATGHTSSRPSCIGARQPSDILVLKVEACCDHGNGRDDCEGTNYEFHYSIPISLLFLMPVVPRRG